MSSLIIVTGCPGTGKSWMARMLLERFPALEALSYDSFKEKNWDRYGFDSAEEKAALNCRSLEEFYDETRRRLSAGRDVLVEYPFNQRYVPALRHVLDATGARAVTLFLHGDMRVIYQRSQRRDDHDHRHPGHLYNRYHPLANPAAPEVSDSCRLSYEAFLEECGRKDYDIRLGYNIPVDVTRFDEIPYGEIVHAIEAATGLKAAPQQGGTV